MSQKPLKNTHITATILGCGSSMGTPDARGDWGVCDPNNPKNVRRRCSLLMRLQCTGAEDFHIIVDTGPDMRSQLLDLPQNDRPPRLDAVFYTHAHSDHINGLEEVRPFSYNQRTAIPAYGSVEALGEITRKFPHAIHGAEAGNYPSILTMNSVKAGQDSFEVAGLPITVIDMDHVICRAFGYRIGNFAYCVDFKFLDEAAMGLLQGLDIWIVDCTDRVENPIHSHLPEVLKMVDKLQPKLTILTDLKPRMDYETLCRELPAHIRPAYDGMQFEFTVAG